MSSLSAPAPTEASSVLSTSVPSEGGVAGAESFGAVVERLLDAATTAGAGLPAEADPANVATDVVAPPPDAGADGNVVLLALAFPFLAAQAQPLVPLPSDVASADAAREAVDEAAPGVTGGQADGAGAGTATDVAVTSAATMSADARVAPSNDELLASAAQSSNDILHTGAPASHARPSGAGVEAITSFAAQVGSSARSDERAGQGEWHADASTQALRSDDASAVARTVVADISRPGGITEPAPAAESGSARLNPAAARRREAEGPVTSEVRDSPGAVGFAPVGKPQIATAPGIASMSADAVTSSIVSEGSVVGTVGGQAPVVVPSVAAAATKAPVAVAQAVTGASAATGPQGVAVANAVSTPQAVIVPSADAAPAAGAVAIADTGSPASTPALRGHQRTSPQAARLAAFLSQGEVGRIHPVAASVAPVAAGQSVAEGQPRVHADVPQAAAARPVDLALPDQSAPSATREASAKFLGFDASVAALTADAFRLHGASGAGLASSGDSSGRSRDRGAYDLRSSSAPAAMADLLDGRAPLVLDGRYSQMAAMPGVAPSLSSIPSGSLPEGTHAAMGDVPTQIVRAMHLQWREGVGEARLTLNPESLGEVTIVLKVTNGSVTATVKADNPVTMEWIRSHQHELRSALDDQGLRLDQFDVTVNPDDRRQQQESHEALPQPSRRQRRSVPGYDSPRFELHV